MNRFKIFSVRKKKVFLAYNKLCCGMTFKIVSKSKWSDKYCVKIKLFYSKKIELLKYQTRKKCTYKILHLKYFLFN